MKAITTIGLCLISLVVLGGCDNDADSVPAPQAMTDAAIGVYCGMILSEHIGPKGQVFEKARADPLWFASVRDAIAYTRLPGEAQDIVAFYVHDMARADSWEKPQADGIWIAAETAYYVLGSNKRGGMGMQETIPFGSIEAARNFSEQHGGQVMKFDEIPSTLLLSEK